jgi:chorismate synthase
VSIEIGNTEWPKWVQVMSADPLEEGVELPETGRNAPLSRPRPGHADLTGMRKYGFQDSRPILERSSARETASRVALGAVAGNFLEQTLGIRVISQVLSIGGVGSEQDQALPSADDAQRLDASPVRTLDPDAEQRMISRIDQAQKAGDTLGGVIEVIAYGVPAGLGTYVESDRRLDAALASAFMGIQAIKGVEIGDGFLEAERPGSQAHDEIVADAQGHISRQTNRAGGIEGGMSNGEPIRVRAAMKPISSVPRALKTIDVLTGEPATAIHQRSDITAVPAAAVVAEAMMRLTLASFVLEKFGGDNVEETARNARQYIASWPEHLR